ncbi:NADP-dependent isocitrate dehydrogenase [Streptomyces sp. ICC4]|nr:NADP-dependent isocitrate dehydrogenase [Streptomyces sp. ICC4]
MKPSTQVEPPPDPPRRRGGYYQPDAAKAAAIMRPSATLNQALAILG